mgnify:CR=1 FL=1
MKPHYTNLDEENIFEISRKDRPEPAVQAAAETPLSRVERAQKRRARLTLTPGEIKQNKKDREEAAANLRMEQILKKSRDLEEYRAARAPEGGPMEAPSEAAFGKSRKGKKAGRKGSKRLGKKAGKTSQKPRRGKKASKHRRRA